MSLWHLIGVNVPVDKAKHNMLAQAKTICCRINVVKNIFDYCHFTNWTEI